MATATEPVAPERERQRSLVRTTIKLVVGVGLAFVVVQVAIQHRDELTGARFYLEDLNPAWIAAAVFFETVSMLSFTALQRRLLRAGGLALRMRPLVVITLAGNAMANSFPAGGVFASVFAYRQFRRRGADKMLAGWTLIAVTGVTAVALAVLAVAGAVIAGDESTVTGLTPLIALMLVVPLAGVAVLVRPRLLLRVAVPPLELVKRISGRPRRAPWLVITEVVARLEVVTPRWGDWVVCLALGAANWTADCSCLVAAFLAVGAPVPVQALLLAYGAAQLAANLPITPGGLGVVEGSLTVALVAFGGSTEATVAAVLVYRILSFWILLPLGWIAWGALRLQARRADHRTDHRTDHRADREVAA